MDEAVSSEATVLGLDNIPLDLPIAGAGSRVLCAALDYLIVGILVIVWGAGCIALGVMARRGWWAVALFLVGFFLIEYGYFAGVEIAREGQTFGKWALGLRVVTRDGARPGTAALLLRNVVRIVDMVVGVPLMATDPLARRLGDRLADTLVIHTHVPARETVARRTPAGWDAEDTVVLETFLRRAPGLESARAERMARELLETIKSDDPALAQHINPAVGPVEALRQLVEGG